jgi:hypothetical protein
MPIQSDDIKLLRSAVMADVPEGGGAMTGVQVIDGQSNNIFPDTSTDDRAGGRFQVRKVFGVAHTDDTDTLMGASFAVLAPPADPLVHVALFETPGWADTREQAVEMVERYLVKGPRLSSRIMDTHYTGSLLLQLYQVGGANFPAAGDAITLRNPNGQEQYVRVLKVTLGSGNFNVTEGGSVTTFAANIAVCELGQALAFDVLGPPIARVTNEAAYAIAYTTTIASGVAFHGVKPLAAPAVVGDRSVFADGGIYSPLVPAATVEEPLIDIAPLTTRQSLSRTAQAVLTLPAQTLTMQPGTLLRLPTAVQPGSLTITRGATVFTDDGAGALRQGTTTVGSVDYRSKTVTMAAGSPSYGSASTVIAYLPATPSGAATHSDALTITTANQGLAFVAAFEPPPAPGTFTLSYMAQGRWYDLVDNGNGKLAGADSSYGAGTINYSTGSIAYTLGAIPDVGSSVIYGWGDSATAVAIDPAVLPARVSAVLPLDFRAIPTTLTLAWSRGATNYTAAVNSSGALTGDATGQVTAGGVRFAPAVLPDGPVALEYSRVPAESSVSTNLNNGDYQLALTPVVPGSVRLTVGTVPQSGFEIPSIINLVDHGTGHLISTTFGSVGVVMGTVNYTTGAVSINATTTMQVYENVVQHYPVGSNTLYYEARVLRNAQAVTLLNSSVNSIQHSQSAGPLINTASVTPAWALALPVLAGLTLKTDGLAFSVGNATYTAQAGTLAAGWDAITGAGTPAGSVASGGAVTVTSLPANGTNAITWHNAAQDRSAARVGQGVFRVASAPIKTGVFQIQAGALVGSSNNSGVISGGGWNGSVDFQRGIVRWNRVNSVTGAWFGGITTWENTTPIGADELTYNAVFLQYVPLDAALLGVETARLPLDGKVPIYRAGGQVLVHNTLTTALPNPLTKGTTYSLGRERIAAVTVRTLGGVRVSGALYEVDFNAGTIVFPVPSDLTGLDQPFAVEHRIEDELMALSADISGQIALVAALTHDYPAGTSYVSSKLRKGDLFARAFGYTEQTTWTGVWSDDLIGTAPTASYNDTDYPLAMTNRGAITERWAVIFTGATSVRVVGEDVGQVLTGVSINTDIAPLNPQTGVPYFSIPALGWGGGWATGNVLRFNTAACGSAAWVSRAVLQGPATVASDSAVIAFRADVDA